MPNLYKITTRSEKQPESFSVGEILSVKYHDIFDFPLNLRELIRWRAEDTLSIAESEPQILVNSGYYFLEGKEGTVYKRMLRSRISAKKIEIAKRASKIMSFIPNVRMVAITGSLAMENSTDESDIDLMIVTKSGRLWLTRPVVYLLLRAFGFQLRKPNDKNQKDKLCLNIWLDESDLKWSKNRNIFTAHEIAQIVPILNKDKTYERFLQENKWILDFWSNAVKIKEEKYTETKKTKRGIFEWLAYKLQCAHMRSKITKETVTPTRALFHPQDLSEFVLSRFSSDITA